MSRIVQMMCRVTTRLMKLFHLKPAGTVTTETGYPDLGEYSLSKCELLAQLAEQAAQFRDTGGSREQLLAALRRLVQKINFEEIGLQETERENMSALAQAAVIIAYENRPLSPKKLHEATMKACIRECLVRLADAQGKTIGAMRSCAIDSREHEALLEEVFQLMSTDTTILAAARKQAQESIETTMRLLTEFRNNRDWSVEEYQNVMCTEETRESFLKETRMLASAKQEVLERNAKAKPNP